MVADQGGTPGQEDPAALDKAKALMKAGRFADAAHAVRGMLDSEPEHTEALYLLAVAERYCANAQAARHALDRLRDTAPHYGRGYQERGHLALKQGHTDEAIAAYEQAVALNPALPASWTALHDLHTKAGHASAAERARAMAERLAGLPPELVSVTSFLHEGHLLKAERLCRAFLRTSPHHVEGMRLLAAIGARLHVLDDAEFLLETALELKPDYILAQMDYVEVLQKRQKFDKALEEADRLFRQDPENPVFGNIYANSLMAVGRHDEALAMFDKVLGTTPEPAPVHLSRGHAFKTVGKGEDAQAAYRAAYAARPDFGDAFWSLANLKTYRFTDEEVAQMERMVEAPATAPVDRYHLCFALGKAHEDRADPERAFRSYDRGNALKKAELRYDADRMDAELKRQMDQCTQDLFEAKAGQGHDAPDPVFIVGLPRAGSTLIEQILASHSQVDGTLELPNILAMAHRLNGRRTVHQEARYPANLHELDGVKLKELGEAFIRETQIHRQGAPLFTDKMPNNFRHIGLIHLILPNAKIIDARRHPLSCCFSGFKQLFADGQEFTYGLEEIGRYYRGYVELMDHWDRVLPGRVLRVQYEDVVADTPGQVARILEHCGLPFEEACVDFHKTERSVRTASAEQVRQPIYTSGIDQWQHFEPWLDPLKAALGPVLERDDVSRLTRT